MRQRKREQIGRYGSHGASARVFIERGGEKVRVQWRQQGALKTQSWPNTPENQAEARAFADTIAQELRDTRVPRARLTIRQLWQKHSEAEFSRLRPRTCALRSADWRKWEVFVGRDEIAEDVGRDKLVEFRSSLEALGLGSSTVRETIKSVKLVYAWGLEHEVLRRDRLAPYKYKVAKNRQPEAVAEFRQEELTALLNVVPLDDGRTWRAHGVLALCGYQGTRQWSVLHLQWADLDFEAGLITWQALWDKNGKTWVQPMRPQTRAVLGVCRRRAGDSVWVFPASSSLNKGPVYTAQSLWYALVAAEKRAGIRHKRNRGAHGLRRLLAGEVMALTGNVKDAADAIGDKVGVMERYLVRREDRVREVFEALDTPKPSPKPQPETAQASKSLPTKRARQDSNLRPTAYAHDASAEVSPHNDTLKEGLLPASDNKSGDSPPETATQTVTPKPNGQPVAASGAGVPQRARP